jgi:hypothetical protein
VGRFRTVKEVADVVVLGSTWAWIPAGLMAMLIRVMIGGGHLIRDNDVTDNGLCLPDYHTPSD